MLKQETRPTAIPVLPPTTETSNKIPPLFRGRLAFASFMEKPVRKIAHLITYPMFKAGTKMIRYENLDENMTALSRMVNGTNTEEGAEKKDILLAVVTSHTSHSDIVPGEEIVREIRSFCPQIEQCYIPIAASLALGIQGPLAQLLYSEATLPFLDQQEIKPLPLVTENDQKKRGLKPSMHESRRLRRAAIEPNSAFLDFAEGSVEGGRHDVLGHEKGMQEVTNPFLPYVFQQAHKEGKTVIVLPVGISGTNRVLSAEYIFLTLRSTAALFETWAFKRPPILAVATLGHPFIYPNEPGKDLTRNQKEVNDTIMEAVASLKPLRERGFYDPRTRDYQAKMKAYESTLGRVQRWLLKRHLLPHPTQLKQLAEEYSKILAFD